MLWFTTTINYKVEIKKGLFSMGGPITFRDQSFTLSENSDNETIIGALDATQPDNKPLTFTIINNIDSDGDGNSAFSIDGTNLLVDDSDDFDYETNPNLNITIEASDGELTSTATITVNLSDVEEFTIIESAGEATFAKAPDKTYWIIDGDQKLQLKNLNGESHSDNTDSNWDGIAVEPNNDANGYDFLLKGQNKRVNQAYVWNTNDEGVILNNSGWRSGGGVFSWEEKFNVDLNGDEVIGTSFTTIEDKGTATFAKGPQGNYWIIDGDQKLQLQKNGGQNHSDSTNPNWNGIAVERNDLGGYDVLLKGENKRSGQAYAWNTNGKGVIISNSGWKSGGTLLSWEEKFDIDLNNDGVIGSSFTTIEDEGTATFAKDSVNTYWIINGNEKVQLQNSKGQNYSDNTHPNWDGIAVETNDSGGYEFLLEGKNGRNNQAYLWTTNSKGVITDSSGWKSKGNLLSWEEKFNIDLNGDEIIGPSFTIVESEGTATFAKYADGTYWIIDQDKKLQLQNSRGETYNDYTSPNWDGAAVEANESGGYKFLVKGKNQRSDEAYVWTTDAEGVITKGSYEDVDFFFTTIKSEGTVTFLKNLDGTYWIIDEDKKLEQDRQLQLQSSQGENYSDKTDPNWDGVAAIANESGGYEFLLQGKDKLTGQAYVMTTDAEGIVTSTSGWKSGVPALSYEEKFNFDINGDGIISPNFTTVESDGTATFAKYLDGTYWIIDVDEDKKLQLKHYRGHNMTDGSDVSWDGVAVETNDSGGYRVVFKGQNSYHGQAFVWTHNSEGRYSSTSGWRSGNSMLPWEGEFNVDLNGDNIIG